MSLSKLTIVAYQDDSYKDEKGKFEVLINPATYKTTQLIAYDSKQAHGSAASDLRFKHVAPTEISFTLHFDGTNLVATAPKSLKGKTVHEQIKAFEDVATEYKGKVHRPNPLKLSWGKSFSFFGVLVELTIDYKLLKPDGSPLRAEATAKFKASARAKDTLTAVKQQSPDVTHIKKFRAGDTLPSLCDAVYGGTNYFVQVAGANQLDRLRGLAPGQSLNFPPLEEN